MNTTTQADYSADLALVEKAVVALGHQRINPESLEELQDYTNRWGWNGLVADHTGQEVRAAYMRVMAGFRALFAPA